LDQKIGRRNFFESVIKWILGITVVSWIPPIIAYIYPKSKGSAENIFMDPSGNAIAVSAIVNEGSGIGLAFGTPAVIINYKGDLRAFSAVCTHLGCIVQWKKDQGIFLCPCHAGKFDPNGNVISGPPPKPLPRYALKVEENKIQLSKA
jgi:cytochrome b6-f complex iron-sulfur subunit